MYTSSRVQRRDYGLCISMYKSTPTQGYIKCKFLPPTTVSPSLVPVPLSSHWSTRRGGGGGGGGREVAAGLIAQSLGHVTSRLTERRLLLHCRLIQWSTGRRRRELEHRWKTWHARVASLDYLRQGCHSGAFGVKTDVLVWSIFILFLFCQHKFAILAFLSHICQSDLAVFRTSLPARFAYIIFPCKICKFHRFIVSTD